MNKKLANLLSSQEAVKTLREGLPLAFEIAEFESNRVRLDPETGLGKLIIGQEVGFLRERILLSFLITQLGDEMVRLPSPEQRIVNASVAGRPLDIKTVTGRTSITAKWTADNFAAEKVRRNFEFVSDMLLTRIWWGLDRESLFYIPVDVLIEIADSKPNYLYSDTGTNNRGVKVRSAFMKEAEEHPDTVKVSINWKRQNGTFTHPIDKYKKYWNECDHS